MTYGSPNERSILAFVHIEKAAGTTLIDLLFQNFGFRCCEVRPLYRESGSTFSARDMVRTLSINPFTTCIVGHSVKPFGDLREAFPEMRFITLLRDPVKRCVSHYVYWTKQMSRKTSFEEFLALEGMRNLQTRKIAGAEDVVAAKRILRDQFLLVGLAEQFDRFVLLLQRKLQPLPFDPHYRRMNVSQYADSSKLLEQYESQIVEANRLDLELHEYVRTELLPDTSAESGSEFEDELQTFAENPTGQLPTTMRRWGSFVYRRPYFEGVSGLIRRAHGLPASGSYGSDPGADRWDGAD